MAGEDGESPDKDAGDGATAETGGAPGGVAAGTADDTLGKLMMRDEKGSDPGRSDAPDAPPQPVDPTGGALLEGLPFAKALGIRLLSAGEGAAVLSIPYAPEIVGDPETGVIHGGAVTTLLDTCAGVAAMASPTQPGSVATLDLRIDYLRPATPGRYVVAEARCAHETRSVTFVHAIAHDGDAAAPVAMAIGAFMVEGRRRPPRRIGGPRRDET